MPHYLNIDDYDDRQWIIEDDENEEEVIIKINKKLIPRDYTFYKIHKNGCENYIGSTVNLYMREALHKHFCNDEKSKGYNFPVYQYIRDNGGFDTFEFEVLDTKYCCQVDAEIYEAELMKIHKSKLNVKRNYTDADKKQHHKDYNKEYQKTDKFKDYQKQYKRKNKKKQDKINITINLSINLPQD